MPLGGHRSHCAYPEQDRPVTVFETGSLHGTILPGIDQYVYLCTDSMSLAVQTWCGLSINSHDRRGDQA